MRMDKRRFIAAQLTIMTLVLFVGCVYTGGENPEEDGAEEIEMEIEVESFRRPLTISARWKGNVNAQEYVLMRARDEVDGIGEYEQIYRGHGTTYTDTRVQNDIRYVYRVDMLQKGKTVEGGQTGIGVGSAAEADMNEPNDAKETAVAISSFRRAATHYFRFSDGRELADSDWYKTKVAGGDSAYVQVREDGAAGASALVMSIEGRQPFAAENGKWYELRNEAEIEKELYIEIYADKESYLEAGLAGGWVRGYTVIRSDSMDDEGGGGNGSGGSGGEGNGEGGGGNETGEDPGQGIIEERSELFERDASGRIVFLLNEKKYSGRSYTFWKYLESIWNPVAGMTIELVKESGNFLGGYGFFFAGGNIAGYGQCMLVILLQKDGNYAIGKAVEGNYEEIAPWRSSEYLRKGYGVKNTVGVRRDNAGEYLVTINGMEEARFTDARDPVCTGTRTGIVAVITAAEQFPQTPVKAGYRQ